MSEEYTKKQSLSSLAKAVTTTIESWENVAGEFTEKKQTINMDYELAKGAFTVASEVSKRYPISFDALVNLVDYAPIPSLLKPVAKDYMKRLRNEPWDNFVDILSKTLKAYGKGKTAEEAVREIGTRMFREKILEGFFGEMNNA